MIRKHLPNSYEIDCRNNCKREVLNVAINVQEAVHVRAFTRDQISSLVSNISQEKDGYVLFCQNNPSFTGIFYPQFLKGTMLTQTQLSALDFIQDIRNSNIRLLIQRGIHVGLDEFSERVNTFKDKFKGKRIIPVIDIDLPAIDIDNLSLLSNKLDVLIDNFDEIIVIYRGRISYKKVWNLMTEKLSGKNWGAFEVPTKSDNGFCLEGFCFTKGARFTCHYRSLIGRQCEPKFVNTNFKLTNSRNADSGAEMYGLTSRNELIANSIPSSSIGNFAKWDRIVQLNKLCQMYLDVENINQIRIFQEAHRYFSQ